MPEGPSLSAGRLRINNLLGGRRWKALLLQADLAPHEKVGNATAQMQKILLRYLHKKAAVCGKTHRSREQQGVGSTCEEDPAE